MRFILTVGPGSPEARLAEGFDEKVFLAQMAFNEAMHQAGVLIASEGLNPAKKGAHVRIKSGKKKVVDGPFAETKELVGGFYLIEVQSREEALKWAERYPGGMWDDEVLEVRELTGSGDLPPGIVELIIKAAPTWSATFTRPRSGR